MKKFTITVLLLFYLSNAQVLNVQDFGAKGDGNTLDTIPIIKAITECENMGGCKLVFPSGTYLTGSFNLTSNMILYLNSGAMILGSKNTSDFALIDALPSFPIIFKENSQPRYSSLIHAYNLTNISIEEEGQGTIDGNGEFWWELHDENKLNYSRPFLVELMFSQYIKIDQVTLQNSPFWTLHLYSSDSISVDGISISNPVGTPNTDGIDVDSSTNVVIENSYISTGDDHISLKSGMGEEGFNYAHPTKNVLIRNMTLGIGAGIAIGSETAGGVQDILITNNSLETSANAVRIKGCVYYGGNCENITYSNIEATGVDLGIFVNMYYECQVTNSSHYSIYKDINIQNLHGEGITAGEITCAKESPCIVNMNDVDLWTLFGFKCSYVNGTTNHVYPSPCY